LSLPETGDASSVAPSRTIICPVSFFLASSSLVLNSGSTVNFNLL